MNIDKLSEEELNEAVAKALGWKPIPHAPNDGFMAPPIFGGMFPLYGVPNFTKDWSATGAVIDDGVKRGFSCTIIVEPINSSIPNACQFYDRITSKGYDAAGGDDIKILICRSYLKVIGKVTEDKK